MWAERDEQEQRFARGALIAGALLVVVLVFICLRFAFERATNARNPFNRIQRAERLVADDGPAFSPGSPLGGGGGNLAARPGYRGNAARPPALLPRGYAAATAPPTYPVPALPAPPSMAAAAAPTPDLRERSQRAATLSPLREVMDVLRETDARIAQKIAALVGGEQQREADRSRAVSAAAAAASVKTVGTGDLRSEILIRKEDARGGGGGSVGSAAHAAAALTRLRTQVRMDVEGLSALVTVTLHPGRYPEEIRAGVDDIASEMRLYLKLTEMAVENPAESGPLRQRAAQHLSRSQQALSRLESGYVAAAPSASAGT